MDYEIVENSGVECFSPSQVMGLLNISRAATYKLFNSESFPSFTVGERCLRVTKKDLISWVNKQKNK